MPQYEILEVLGRGGMGIVYKAKDTILNRIIAMKVFHENLAQHEVVIKRFLREINITAQLDHPNIVKVYSFEKRSDQACLVMEWIQGQPLLEYIEKNKTSLKAKLEILIKIANALHYAHRKKILHRDIKPSNIMVRTNGEPVLLDFGISKCVGLDELTRTGEFLGTIEYASPEQAEGRRREIDHRTDVYSLGAVMYHVLSGQAPFSGDTFNEMLYQVECEAPVPIQELHPEIPAAVEQICFKALAKDKEQRYDSAQEFANDIQNYLSGKTTQAKRWVKQQVAKRWLSRTIFFVGILLFLAMLALGGYFYAQQQKITEKERFLDERIQRLQAVIEQQSLWSIDQLELWRQTSQHGQEAYHFYQQNRQWIENPELNIRLSNYRKQVAYKLGIHQWIEDQLQSTHAFASVLDISLSTPQQWGNTQLAVLAANMHLQYLSHHYLEVCETFPSFIKVSAPTFKKQSDLFAAYPEVLFLVAKSHYHCQQYEDAQKYLQVLTNHPNFIAHHKIQAELLYYQGMCYYYNEQYQSALENFKNAEQAWQNYNKPVDFGIYLLIYLGDCQSQLLPYSEKLSSQQTAQLEQLIQRMEKEIEQLPPQAIARALYYELKARLLLCPIVDTDPSSEQVEKALEMVAKSSQILPCRYTQHLLRGIAFRYQGKTNFEKYHKAWQAFNHAYQLQPHQADSFALLLDLNSEYLHYSRDQISDLIIHLLHWNNRMEDVAIDFYGTRMKQLELQCHGQLQKFVGIPYQQELADRFYNDLESPVASIRQLAQSCLIDLVSYQDGLANHQLTRTYLEQKLKPMDDLHPLRATLVSILQAIDTQTSQEESWQHLYLLVRISYRGVIPNILLAECNEHPGMISFLMKMLQDTDGKIMPELKSSWPWLQYLAARILIQLPYPLDAKTVEELSITNQATHIYARQILYKIITSPTDSQSFSPTLCLSIAKALKDVQFLWWDHSQICQWFHAVWPRLKDDRDPQDMWQQTNLVSLLLPHLDENTRRLLTIIYKETKYDLVKAFLVHELPQDETNFLPELIVANWYHWLNTLPKQPMQNSQTIHQLRIINIMNTKVICPYITKKYHLQLNNKNRKQDLANEYKKIMTQLARILEDEKENIKVQKAVMTTIFTTRELKTKWYLSHQENQQFQSVSMLKLLKSSDQETRLLAIAITPLIGDEPSLQELAQEALNPDQLLIEKLALFYGILNGISQRSNEDMQHLLSKIKNPHFIGWTFAMECHLYHYKKDMVRNEDTSNVHAKIPSLIVKHLQSSSLALLCWTLMSVTRLDEYHQNIYNKMGKMLQQGKFPSPMLEMLCLGILMNISIKHNLTKDYQKWIALSYEKLKNPRFRPYLSILVWGDLQTMRNNAINAQIYTDVVEYEGNIEIQDLNWLRYQKNLIDPRLHRYAEMCLAGALELFSQFEDNLTILEQEQLQQVELMLAELYYRDGKIEKANQILEKNKKHLVQIPIAMLWAEHNPQRIHEILSSWNEKIKQEAADAHHSSMLKFAMLKRISAIQHIQKKHNEMAIQDLTTSTLLEPREVQSWVLLAEAMIESKQLKNGVKILREAHYSGFYQARISWAWIQHCAKYAPVDQRHNDIWCSLLNAGSLWEYPITFQMLKNLGCKDVPSGGMCYLLACNHANSGWHYEACYWLKEAARLNCKLHPLQRQIEFPLFEKYKADKYKGYDVQPAIKQLFESK